MILFLIRPPSISFNFQEVVVFFLFLLPLQSVMLGKRSAAVSFLPSHSNVKWLQWLPSEFRVEIPVPFLSWIRGFRTGVNPWLYLENLLASYV